MKKKYSLVNGGYKCPMSVFENIPAEPNNIGGSGTDINAHMHVADQCVPKGMAGLAGGCPAGVSGTDSPDELERHSDNKLVMKEEEESFTPSLFRSQAEKDLCKTTCGAWRYIMGYAAGAINNYTEGWFHNDDCPAWDYGNPRQQPRQQKRTT